VTRCATFTTAIWARRGILLQDQETLRLERVKKLRFQESADFSSEEISIGNDMSDSLTPPGHFSSPAKGALQFFHTFLSLEFKRVNYPDYIKNFD
jgi:hypothetical protein